MPTGLSIYSSNGTIIGTPTTPSSLTLYNITATTTFNYNVLFPLSITIGPISIQYLIVAGGGAGGYPSRTGGGGAGGEVLYGSFTANIGANISITVGNGGIYTYPTLGSGSNSNISSIYISTLTARGGGYGGGDNTAPYSPGFGGGFAHGSSGNSSGEGKTTGGNGYNGGGAPFIFGGGGGGGGGSDVGHNATNNEFISLAGIGATGYTSNIADGLTNIVYGSGGGGGLETTNTPISSYIASGGENAGLGGVSDSNNNANYISAIAPIANYGGGGGGGSGSGANINYTSNNSGASGVVIFRYNSISYIFNSSGSHIVV